MALLTVQFMAASLGLCTSMHVVIPDSPPPAGGWPVFYLLHGRSDDHSVWLRRSSIERHIDGTGLVCVMPTTHRGWYVNSVTNPMLAYENHIIKDVLGFVEQTLPVKKERTGRAIGGLSMGGYGALKLALKFPELFASATSHSGAVLGPHWETRNNPKLKTKPDLEVQSIFGKKIDPREDPKSLAAACPKKLRPALRIDCGTEDFLLQDNRAFHAALDQLKFPHEYQEFPGTHNWAYWDTHVQEAIAFHLRVMQRA